MDIDSLKSDLLSEIEKLNSKFELSQNIPENYFEPGMMENLDQYYGKYDEGSNTVVIKTNIKGLRYEGRTIRLDDLTVGKKVKILRESFNAYNSNNFMIVTLENESLGNLSADLCNVIAPLYDRGYLTIENAIVSYIEKIQDRSRYAKQGVLFVEITAKFRGI